MTSLASALVRRYPLAWRERYEPEVLALLEDSPPGLRDLLELTRGLLVERVKSWVEPGEHPYITFLVFRTSLALMRVLPAVVLAVGAALLGDSIRVQVGPPPEDVENLALAGLLVALGIYYRRYFAVVWRTMGTSPADRDAEWRFTLFPKRWALPLAGLFVVCIVVMFWTPPWQNTRTPPFFHWWRWLSLYIWIGPIHSLLAGPMQWRAFFSALEAYMATIEGLVLHYTLPGSGPDQRRIQLEARRDALRATLDGYGYRARFRKS
jgi:hypothetical protein